VILVLMISDVFSQTINITPNLLYFGKIPEGKQAIRDILIYNIGSNTLNITNLRIEGTNATCFKMVSNPGNVSLGIAQKLVLQIEFIPSAEGNFSAKITIESNASTSPDFADLSGEGTRLDDGFIAFERIFGGPNNDGAGSVIETADKGFVIAGSTVRLNEEYNDASLIKLDAYGQIEWNQWYGEEQWSESFSEVIATEDGGYIAVGSHSYSEQRGEPNIYAIKTDASGNLIWEKSYGKSEYKPDAAADVTPSGDGGYLIAGYSQSQQNKEAYLIKIDADGNIIWEKTYGGSGGDEINKIRQTTDGGFVFVGSSSSFYTGSEGDFDFYLVKIDAEGNLIWEKHYGGTDWDRANSFVITNDGGYLMVGYTASPEFGAVAREIYLVKVDADGNKQWQKIYGWEHKDSASDVIVTRDGGYLIVGSSERLYDSDFDTWRSDLYVIKTDGSGNELWSKLFGGVHDESASCVRQVSDGGFIISGRTKSYSKDSEIYLLKLDKSGGFSFVFDYLDILPTEFHLFQNYPNPFNNITSIGYQLSEDSFVELNVYNISGQIVRRLIQKFQQAGSYQIKFEADALPSGLYFYQIRADHQSNAKRMLLLK
ncbi:MAG: choice-of-anchor D domain-containing protein, partial [bacterium]|nr:choice-of-anchor D domain-containing protein [bacterium]